MGLWRWFWGPDSAEPMLERSEQMDAQIDAFWDSLQGVGVSPRLIDRVWVAARCLQLNAQQIASMPLRFTGGFENSRTPAWVSSPDPVWFPNGIGDCVFAAIDSMYRWGDAFLVITSRYADGLPQLWTVADASRITVELDDRGRRKYRIDETPLPAADVVQVSRDPRGGLRGTSALAAYASQMTGAVAGSDLSRAIQEGGVPKAVLQSTKFPLTEDQAALLKSKWALSAASRRGEPLIIGPDMEFKPLAFSPQDMELLASQEFNARVIASAFGVPPFMLNLPLTGGLTYQNPAMLGEMWYRFELNPAAERLSDALTAQMLPAGSSVEFDASKTFAPLVSPTGEETAQEPQPSPVAPASPSQQNGSGVVQALRPMNGVL